jgi:hypothetical protein
VEARSPNTVIARIRVNFKVFLRKALEAHPQSTVRGDHCLQLSRYY